MASGNQVPLWRGSIAQVLDEKADDLCAELLDYAARHAEERSANVRFFARWLDSDEKILLAHPWRQGHGDLMPLDGTPESVLQQLQGTVKALLGHEAARQDAMYAMLETVVGSLHGETKLLRQENRELRLALASGTPAAPAEGAEGAVQNGRSRNSVMERVAGDLMEHAGKKWIDENIKAIPATTTATTKAEDQSR